MTTLNVLKHALEALESTTFPHPQDIQKNAITALKVEIERLENVCPPFIPVMYIHPVDIGRHTTGTVQRENDKQLPLFLHPAPAPKPEGI